MSTTRPSPGYREPGDRNLPAPTVVGGVSQGIVVPPDKWFVKCVCGHQAYRSAPNVEDWVCGCASGQCHGPTQVAGPDGSPQLVWAPFRIRPFPAPPGTEVAELPRSEVPGGNLTRTPVRHQQPDDAA